MNDKTIVRFKKNRSILLLSSVMVLILGLSGCSAKNYLSYQEALEMTSGIDKGSTEMEVDVKIDFNKAGLSLDEEKDLSPFEEMKTKIRTKYDFSESENMETEVYTLIGPMGIDSGVYIIDEDLFIQIPIINMFLKPEGYITDTDDSSGSSDSIDTAIIEIDFDQILKSWISVFNEDNVVVGNTTYILTDEGQIKTTVYEFNLSEEQLEELQVKLFEELDTELLNDLLNEFVLSNSLFGDSKSLEVLDIATLVDMIHLTKLEGEAYVDFDNRLIRQNFILYGEGNNPIPGNMNSFEISFSQTYSNLGEEQDFDFPEINDDNTLEQEDIEKIFNQFYEED